MGMKLGFCKVVFCIAKFRCQCSKEFIPMQQNFFGITEFSKQQIFHSGNFNLAVFCTTEFCCQSNRFFFNAADFICITEFSKQQANF